MKSSLRYVEIVTPILLSLALLIQREDQNPSPPHSQSLPVVPVVGTIVDRIVGSVVGAVAGSFNVGGGAGAASGGSGAIHSNIPPPQIRQESTGHEELGGKTIQERQQKKWYQRLFSWRTSQRAVSIYNNTSKRIPPCHVIVICHNFLLWL